MIPKRFKGLGLEDVKPGPAIDAVRRYLECDHEPGVGLALFGAPGTGKTTAGCVLLNEIKQKTAASVKFITLAAFVKLHIDMIRTEQLSLKFGDHELLLEHKVIAEKLFDMRNKVDYLMIDDVGKEHTTGSRFAEDEFDFLLRYRFDRGLPTIITSNVPIPEWGGRYSEAMESFIHEAMVVAPVGGSDYRR